MSEPRTTLDIAIELHQELTRELLARLKQRGRTAVDTLQVARQYLVHEGLLGGPHDPAELARLRALYRLYCRRLAEGLEQPNPPASLLQECARFCTSQGVSKDFGAAVTLTQAVQALSSASIPFTTSGAKQ
jgi:hypothetical protein